MKETTMPCSQIEDLASSMSSGTLLPSKPVSLANSVYHQDGSVTDVCPVTGIHLPPHTWYNGVDKRGNPKYIVKVVKSREPET